MKSRVVWGILFFQIAGLVCAAEFPVVYQTVRSNNGLACETQLQLPEQRSVDSILFFLYGTGAFSVRQATNPVALAFLSEHTAVLSFDKPGVSLSPIGLQLDMATFAQHRPQDLTDCAVSALESAAQRYPEAKLVLVGHSAGAWTTVEALRTLVERQSALIPRVQLAVLHGPPLNDWTSVMLGQMKQFTPERRKEFGDAYERRDEAFFLDRSNGAIPLAFHEAMVKQGRLSDSVRDLDVHVDFPVVILQGDADPRCAVEAAQCLQTAFGSPQLRVEYYHGAHDYNAAAIEQLIGQLSPFLLK